MYFKKEKTSKRDFIAEIFCTTLKCFRGSKGTFANITISVININKANRAFIPLKAKWHEEGKQNFRLEKQGQIKRGKE